jgi:hypothetical protein
MKRIAAVCLLLTGCGSAPVANLMDYFAPGRLPPAPGYHGGVGVQQQVAPPPEIPQPAVPPTDGTLPPLPPTNLGAR